MSDEDSSDEHSFQLKSDDDEIFTVPSQNLTDSTLLPKIPVSYPDTVQMKPQPKTQTDSVVKSVVKVVPPPPVPVLENEEDEFIVEEEEEKEKEEEDIGGAAYNEEQNLLEHLDELIPDTPVIPEPAIPPPQKRKENIKTNEATLQKKVPAFPPKKTGAKASGKKGATKMDQWLKKAEKHPTDDFWVAFEMDVAFLRPLIIACANSADVMNLVIQQDTGVSFQLLNSSHTTVIQAAFAPSGFRVFQCKTRQQLLGFDLKSLLGKLNSLEKEQRVLIIMEKQSDIDVRIMALDQLVANPTTGAESDSAQWTVYKNFFATFKLRTLDIDHEILSEVNVPEIDGYSCVLDSKSFFDKIARLMKCLNKEDAPVLHISLDDKGILFWLANEFQEHAKIQLFANTEPFAGAIYCAPNCTPGVTRQVIISPLFIQPVHTLAEIADKVIITIFPDAPLMFTFNTEKGKIEFHVSPRFEE